MPRSSLSLDCMWFQLQENRSTHELYSLRVFTYLGVRVCGLVCVRLRLNDTLAVHFFV